MLKKNRKGYIYLLPALVLLGVFVFYPIIYTIIFSFDETKAAGFQFGFGTYQYLFNDKRFIQSLLNTVIYAVVVPFSSVFISLILAIGLVWSWLFNSEYGIINYLLGLLGVDKINWLNDPKYAMIALIIFAVWKSLAFNTLILTTGIASINPQYYQAAKIDQAKGSTIFRKITIPLVSPMIAYTYMISLIASFKVYTEVYVLFGGRTLDGKVSTVVRYIIDRFYGDQDFPLAFAASVILLLIILTVTMVQKVITRNKIHY